MLKVSKFEAGYEISNEYDCRFVMPEHIELNKSLYEKYAGKTWILKFDPLDRKARANETISNPRPIFVNFVYVDCHKQCFAYGDINNDGGYYGPFDVRQLYEKDQTN